MCGVVRQVICRWVVLCTVICQVGGSAVPIETELPLGFPAAKPMQAHPDHFDAALDDGVIYKPHRSGVVRLNGCFGLWPTHFLECIT